MRAFITGATGQDGSYLAEFLLREGTDVHALVLDHQAGKPLPEGVHAHVGDLTDTTRLRQVLGDVSPDEIYNLGGISSVALAWEQPDLVAHTNGVAALTLLDAALHIQEHDGHRVSFVQASSAEIFGAPTTSPQHEGTPIAPINPYGAAKAYAHHGVGVYRNRGLHAVSAILYNHESPRRPANFVTRKITSTVAAIKQGRADELVLGNLDARRDWGWAPDYVYGLMLAARADEAGDFIFATGQAHSVRDFVGAAFASVGVAEWQELVRTDPAFYRPVDAVELVGDPGHAAARLHWKPAVTFNELVARMVAAELDLD